MIYLLSDDHSVAVQREIIRCYEEQLRHFRAIAEVMEKVDLPKDFWERTLKGMISDVEEAKTLYPIRLDWQLDK